MNASSPRRLPAVGGHSTTSYDSDITVDHLQLPPVAGQHTASSSSTDDFAFGLTTEGYHDSSSLPKAHRCTLTTNHPGLDEE